MSLKRKATHALMVKLAAGRVFDSFRVLPGVNTTCSKVVCLRDLVLAVYVAAFLIQIMTYFTSQKNGDASVLRGNRVVLT